MSSSTLYAQTTKEWIVPPRPKPGRKPKTKGEAGVANGDEEESKRNQNRASQRAFRERKQSQLADLQALVEKYERGEIERNVALQTVAKQLKEENELLKAENALLKSENSCLKAQLAAKANNLFQNGGETSQQGQGLAAPSIPSESSFSASTKRRKRRANDEISADGIPISETRKRSKSTNRTTSVGPSESEATSQTIQLPHVSAVPLRSRRSCRSPAFSQKYWQWHVETISVPPSDPFESVVDENCTGDPSNCPACADIPSNQAFCAALGDVFGGVQADAEIRRASPCPSGPPDSASAVDDVTHESPHKAVARRPTPPISIPISSLCCGDPKLCGGGNCGPHALLPPILSIETSSVSTLTSPQQSATVYSVDCSISGRSRESTLFFPPITTNQDDQSASLGSNATIPCNHAWARLSAHPNIDSADLMLLAEVVACRDHLRVESNARDEVDNGDSSGRAGRRERVVRVTEEGLKDALTLLDTIGSSRSQL
ncbi:uncharacterized protein EI90DRAFT_3016381 [Cantharellus anzutake]|uniref:uncharacterized protein n=1 Tax=Cantharellus anzutake TaxID=1750568 RepID=UPI0019052D05|nr:uncharacterized protein EI90DRAFT_3016381 [Cantharellus anzutake]KAF8331373.1 hypothetical protein EI90DRAFT_3016381 [Cantharellus anzutake]